MSSSVVKSYVSGRKREREGGRKREREGGMEGEREGGTEGEREREGVCEGGKQTRVKGVNFNLTTRTGPVEPVWLVRP